jgi:hypothetical protein
MTARAFQKFIECLGVFKVLAFELVELGIVCKVQMHPIIIRFEGAGRQNVIKSHMQWRQGPHTVRYGASITSHLTDTSITSRFTDTSLGL